ncbi:MAG: hypothetical protein U0746_21235 [Gemmataceae bacterium]
MNDPVRRALLEAIIRLSDVTPDMRFGQLVCAATMMSEGRFADSVYDVEDDELLDAVRQMTVEMEERNRWLAEEQAKAS